MDVSAAALSELNRSTTSTPDTAQLLVLKKAMDVQEQGALALLQALPTALPLATSGTLGTRVNLMA